MHLQRFSVWIVGLAIGCGTSSSGPSLDASAGDASASDGAPADGPGIPYGPCDQCGSLRCESYTFGGGSVHWCAPPCDTTLKGADCPAAPAGSTATPICVEHSSGIWVCALACGASRPCPTPMKCSNNRWCGY